MQPIAPPGVLYPVSNLVRVAITCVTTLLIGALSYANAVDIDRTGILGDVLYSPALDWAFFALLVLTVALVNRWWALSIALVPFAVLYFLHSATDYVYPYHEDPYPALAVMGTAFLLGVSSLGFLLRALLDRAVSEAWVSRLRGKLGE
jgi:hypothetical protein